MPGEGEKIEGEIEAEGEPIVESYRGSGWRAIRRRQTDGGLTPDQIEQFQQEFSDLKVGSNEYRRAIQELSRVSRAGRTAKK